MNYGLTIGIIPIAGTQFTKTSEIETPSLRFPLLAGGTEPTRPTRFPTRSGGNLRRGAFINYGLTIGIRPTGGGNREL